MIIDGSKIAKEIVNDLKNKRKPDKFLLAFVMESDEKSFGFIKKKKELSEKLGVDFRIFEINDDESEKELKSRIKNASKDKECGGVIVQLPLSESLGENKHSILNAIPEEKDVDMLGSDALGRFYNGNSKILPPSVSVLEEILSRINFEVKSKTVSVIGAGFLTGKPITNWLMNKSKEVFVLDKGSSFEILKNSDLVISGAGKPGLIDPNSLKKDSIFIDFGYGRSEKGGVMGDLNAENKDSLGRLKFYTPTPGGTGPILVACLFNNFYILNYEEF